jgi:hypothetical protein
MSGKGTPGLYEFLQEAELAHYYTGLRNILQVFYRERVYCTYFPTASMPENYLLASFYLVPGPYKYCRSAWKCSKELRLSTCNKNKDAGGKVVLLRRTFTNLLM